MKESIFICDSEKELDEIDIDIYDCEVTLCAAEGDNPKVTFTQGRNIKVASGDKRLIICQTKRPLFCRKQSIKIYIPQHIVPSVTVHGKHPDITFDGCLYGDLSAACESGKLSLYHCSFKSVQITTGAAVNISDITVKGNMYIQSLQGDVVAEGAFAPHAEFKLKKGNLGLVEMNCKECVLETLDGNISAAMCGKECEYATSLKANGGTCNRESIAKADAGKSVKAYADGNITLQFCGDKEKPHLHCEEEAAAADITEEKAGEADVKIADDMQPKQTQQQGREM